ncbi:MAG: TIGR02266 family protein [Candidatus Tectomicrobia bacterium]
MEREIKERRRYQRVSARILIKYGNAEQFFTDYIQNISRGGIFVPTYNPLPTGTRLQISFSLPGWDRFIDTEGLVVHSVHGDPQQGGQPSGMGVQFQKLSEESLELIDKYVSSLTV